MSSSDGVFRQSRAKTGWWKKESKTQGRSVQRLIWQNIVNCFTVYEFDVRHLSHCEGKTSVFTHLECKQAKFKYQRHVHSVLHVTTERRFLAGVCLVLEDLGVDYYPCFAVASVDEEDGNVKI